MSEDAVVLLVVDRLEALRIPHMVVGSYASNVYGRARSSFAADIVIDVPPDRSEDLVREFANDFALDPESARRDLLAGHMFNLVPRSGIFKVDLIPLRKSPFAREEFGRRRQIVAFGRKLWFPSPEDVILSKLVWYRLGEELSGRQVEDARDVYTVQQETLDQEYLDRWAGQLGVIDLLRRLRKE